MRFGFLVLALSVSMSFASFADAHEYKAGDLFIAHPAINATPSGAKVAVGYFTIENNGSADDVLLGIDTPGLTKRAEIHSMTMDGGVMKMRKLETLTIPAGQETKLSPSGNHVMFMDLDKAVTADDEFEATLHFKNAGDVKVMFAGEPIGSAPAIHTHNAHH